MGTPPLSLTRSFRRPVLDAWAHITRPELLAMWLGRGELDLSRGAEFTIEHANGDTTRGRVIDAVPPSRLELAIRGSGAEHGLTLLLERDGPGSRVTVVQPDVRHDAEGKRERQFWTHALVALRTALNDGVDASSWGDDIPVLARAVLPRAAADLWPLISTGPGLDKWVAHVDRFDAAQGGAFRLTSRYQGRQIVEEGRIEEITPEFRVVLSWEWAGEGWGAQTRVEFLIEAEARGSLLSVIHSGFENVVADRRLAARKNYAVAWPDVLADLRRLVAPVTS